MRFSRPATVKISGGIEKKIFFCTLVIKQKNRGSRGYV
jgi:hypothetical protein